METKQLAALLGISRRMVDRLKRDGMSTDSLEAEQQWRRENQDATRIKGGRIDGNTGMKSVAHTQNCNDDLLAEIEGLDLAEIDISCLDLSDEDLNMILSEEPTLYRR